MTDIRVGIVGCGGRGRGHMRVLQSFADIELVAVCDPVAESLAKAGREFAIERCYETVEAMLDAEELAGRRFEYQEDRSLVEDLDLLELTPGRDLNWLEDIHMLEEDGIPAVFDRYSNSFLRIYFEIPEGREDELARKVLMKHLISGNSYGIQLKEKHCKFHQVELGPWVADSRSVGDNYTAPVLEGWEAPTH